MNREERLEQIARELYETRQHERASKDAGTELKEEFFRLLDDGLKSQSWKLPVKTIEVPAEFFEKSGMGMEDFVASRFPSWNVEHIEKDVSTGNTTFVLKQNYKYVADIVELPGMRVAKEVSEYSPEIDWETLEKERPDLWERLAKEVTHFEINEEEFDKLVEETPEELATLQRHMKVKPPTLRATARRVKSDD